MTTEDAAKSECERVEAAFRAEFGEDPWILGVEQTPQGWVVDSLLLNTRCKWLLLPDGRFQGPT